MAFNLNKKQYTEVSLNPITVSELDAFPLMVMNLLP